MRAAMPMAEFVRVLSLGLRHSVTDKSSFSGVSNVDLEFRLDDTTVGWFGSEATPPFTHWRKPFSSTSTTATKIKPFIWTR
jgi:hypothetical protein